MLFVPTYPEWQYYTSNIVDTRPATNFGTVITPGENTYGSYTEILSSGNIAEDCYFVEVYITSNSGTAQARDLICTLGKDDSGGTSYADWIPDLLGSSALTYLSGLIGYAFPLYVPAGAAIAAKCSINNATVGNPRIIIKLRGKPKRPEVIYFGTKVTSFGVTAASSSGTTVVPGTTSDGSWTQIGSALTENMSWWQFGLGLNDSTMTSQVLHGDLAVGDATNKRPIFEDVPFNTTSSEQLGSIVNYQAFKECYIGDILYVRFQASSTPDSNYSSIVYGVS